MGLLTDPSINSMRLNSSWSGLILRWSRMAEEAYKLPAPVSRSAWDLTPLTSATTTGCSLVLCCQKSSDTVLLVWSQIDVWCLRWQLWHPGLLQLSALCLSPVQLKQLFLAQDPFAVSNCSNLGTIGRGVAGLITVDTPMHLFSNILLGLKGSPARIATILIVLSFGDACWLSRLDLALTRFNWIDVLPMLNCLQKLPKIPLLPPVVALHLVRLNPFQFV